MSDFEVEIKIQDNSGQVLSELDKSIERAMFYAGNEVVNSTTDYMGQVDFTGRDIVDTGRLRASLSYITPEASGGGSQAQKVNDTIKGTADNNSVLWGSNVEYAGYVNNGTAKKQARKFIQNGYYNAEGKIKIGIEKILKGEL